MIAYTRRDILTMLGSAVLGGCATSHPSSQFDSSRAHQLLFNYEEEELNRALATLTPELRAELQLDVLRKTPIVPRTVIVSYEVDPHSKYSRVDLEYALPFVNHFYQSYGVDITFVPVPKLEPSMIKFGSSFGLTYAPLKRIIHDADLLFLGHYLFPDQRDTVFRFVAGERDTVASSGIHTTLQQLESELRADRMIRYSFPKGISFPSDGRVFVSSTDLHLSFTESKRYLTLARTVAHELGHTWGLNHVRRSSLDGTSATYDESAGFQGYNVMCNSYCDIDPVTPVLPSQKNFIGVFLDPVQVGIVHNYFSRGVVFREVTASHVGYIYRLEEANKVR